LSLSSANAVSATGVFWVASAACEPSVGKAMKEAWALTAKLVISTPSPMTLWMKCMGLSFSVKKKPLCAAAMTLA
jgi:hypothetical protein